RWVRETRASPRRRWPRRVAAVRLARRLERATGCQCPRKPPAAAATPTDSRREWACAILLRNGRKITSSSKPSPSGRGRGEGNQNAEVIFRPFLSPGKLLHQRADANQSVVLRRLADGPPDA